MRGCLLSERGVTSAAGYAAEVANLSDATPTTDAVVDGGEQMIAGKGEGDKGVSADLDCTLAIDLRWRTGGVEDDGNGLCALVTAQGAANLKSIDVGQIQIQQDDVGSGVAGTAKRHLAGVRRAN